MWESIQSWMSENEVLIGWLIGFSFVSFVGSLVALPVLIIRMPADYLVAARVPFARLPVSGMLKRALKNLGGVLLVLAGLAMLVLPGQGLLALLVGFSLIDFPGKRVAQVRLLRFEGVRRSVNWIRARAEKPPLVYPDLGISDNL